MVPQTQSALSYMHILTNSSYTEAKIQLLASVDYAKFVLQEQHPTFLNFSPANLTRTLLALMPTQQYFQDSNASLVQVERNIRYASLQGKNHIIFTLLFCYISVLWDIIFIRYIFYYSNGHTSTWAFCRNTAIPKQTHFNTDLS